MADAEEFRAQLQRRFQEAQASGSALVDVFARDLHAAVQARNPTPTQRIPNCCSVMWQEQLPGDRLTSERSSDGMAFAIRYQIPRPRR